MYGSRIGNRRRMFARHLCKELGGKLALHLFEVFGAGEHLEAVSAVMRFVDAFMEAIGDEPVCTGKNVTIFFRHFLRRSHVGLLTSFKSLRDFGRPFGRRGNVINLFLPALPRKINDLTAVFYPAYQP